jgi:hypothetical protein
MAFGAASRYKSAPMRPLWLALLGALLVPAQLHAQPASEEPTTYGPRIHRLRFDLPAVDVRENLELGFWPSMPQSMALAKDSFYLVNAGILSIPYPRALPKGLVYFLDGLLLSVADFVLVTLPPSEGWMHEEWHRSVMSRYGISSYNGIYDFNLFDDLINVSREKDDDLVRLKREHPADQVRLSAAGIEGDFSLEVEFDKDRFFYRTRAATLFAEWLISGNAIAYMFSAAYDSDATTAEENRVEGSNVEIRDFTGLDPDGWVYDLFRPSEPYEARGVHPSGVGIDRYRSESDFSSRELHYLRTQASLSLLNLVNPNLVGLYQFDVGEYDGLPLSFNASLQYLMAPFGYSLGLNLFGKAGPYMAFAELRAFVNDSLVLPGISLELVRYPLHWLDATLTPRVRLWLQPKDQLFFADSVAPGGALEVRLNLPLFPHFELYAEVQGKTAGWMPGNVFLGPSVNLRTGLEAFVF